MHKHQLYLLHQQQEWLLCKTIDLSYIPALQSTKLAFPKLFIDPS